MPLLASDRLASGNAHCRERLRKSQPSPTKAHQIVSERYDVSKFLVLGRLNLLRYPPGW
jgi:hypothetical protein